MPLEINLPVSGGGVGPGYWVALQQTTPGPIPVDDYWQVQVTHQTNENLTYLFANRFTQGLNFASVLLNFSEDRPTGLSQSSISAQTDEPVRVVVKQFHNDGTQVDSISIPAKWDGAANLNVYGDTRGWGSTQAQGGFTQQDRDKLDQIINAVYRTWPDA